MKAQSPARIKAGMIRLIRAGYPDPETLSAIMADPEGEGGRDLVALYVYSEAVGSVEGARDDWEAAAELARRLDLAIRDLTDVLEHVKSGLPSGMRPEDDYEGSGIGRPYFRPPLR